MFCIASVEISFCIYFLAKATIRKSWQQKYLAAAFLLISDLGLIIRYSSSLDNNDTECGNSTRVGFPLAIHTIF